MIMCWWQRSRPRRWNWEQKLKKKRDALAPTLILDNIKWN